MSAVIGRIFRLGALCCEWSRDSGSPCLGSGFCDGGHVKMEFAKSQLEKHGWSDGKGLGRDETGMKDAIKVKLKFDTTGVGHNPADQFTYHWWSHAFDQAAKSINVDQSKDGVIVNTTNTQELSTRKPLSKGVVSKDLLYGRFIKAATLMDGCMEEESSASSSDSEDGDGDEEPDNKFKQLTDEDLFKLCGGRTAHKGARHGITASAKLSRVEEQEAAFMAKWASPGDEGIDKKQCKTHKKVKGIEEPEDTPSPVQSDTDTKSKKHKKRKNKKTEERVEDEHSNSSGYSSDTKKSSSVPECLNGEESSSKKHKKNKKKKDAGVDDRNEANGGKEKKKRKQRDAEEEDAVAVIESKEVKKEKKKKKKGKDREHCEETVENGQVNEDAGQPQGKRKRKREEKNCDDSTSLIENVQNEASNESKTKKKKKSKK